MVLYGCEGVGFVGDDVDSVTVYMSLKRSHSMSVAKKSAPILCQVHPRTALYGHDSVGVVGDSMDQPGYKYQVFLPENSPYFVPGTLPDGSVRL